jgi:hypothetical protein
MVRRAVTAVVVLALVAGSALLAARGYGRAIRVWPNVTYWPVMERAQTSAQDKMLGLWKAC